MPRKRPTSNRPPAPPALAFHPLTPDRWADLEQLFGERGACGGCWCMYWRRKRSEFDRTKGANNKRAFRKIVADGHLPGILAYADGRPVGWCGVAPRETFVVLENSRSLRRIDDQPVWSITCLFVLRPWRGQGVSVALLRAAVDFVRKRGGRIVEGYPVQPKMERVPDAFAYTGLVPAFLRAGFKEVARPSPTRAIMRAAATDNNEKRKQSSGRRK